MALTVTLLSSASTVAQKQGTFPNAATLTASAYKRAQTIRLDSRRFDVVLNAPDPASLQTAAAVRLSATLEPELAEPGYGSWAGRTIRDIMEEQPEQFASWLRGEFMPGDESMGDLFDRVRRWLSCHLEGRSRIIAVAAPNVVRACVFVALDLTPAHFSRLDIPPLTLSTLTSNGREWRVRSVGVFPAISAVAKDANAYDD